MKISKRKAHKIVLWSAAALTIVSYLWLIISVVYGIIRLFS